MQKSSSQLKQQLSIFSVYTPDGSQLGTIRATHEQSQLSEDTTQVRQEYALEGIPLGHALHDLAGARSYQRQISPDLDVFKGPDFNMAATRFGTCVTGQGFMPQAGFNIDYVEWQLDESSYRFMRLRRTTEVIAVLVGLQSTDGRALSGGKWPAMQSTRWQGVVNHYQPNGQLMEQSPLTRRYNGLQFEDFHNDQRHLTIELELWAPYFIVSGATIGIAKLYDWALLIESSVGPRRLLSAIEVYDEQQQLIVGLHQWQQDSLLQQTNILHLKHSQ